MSIIKKWINCLIKCVNIHLNFFQINHLIYLLWWFTIGGSDSEESTCNEGDLGSIPGLGRSPAGGHGNPLCYLCLENPHGQRSLADYSPWGHKESDATEHSIVHIHTENNQIKMKWRKLYQVFQIEVQNVQQNDSVTYVCVCVCILFRIIFHHRLLQYIEYSSLCSMVGPCCLSLYIVVCNC